MNHTFWNITFAVGVAQGVFLITALLLRGSRNRRAAEVIAAIAAVFTLMTGVELFEASSGEQTALFVAYFGLNAELAIGPLLFLFVGFMLDPERRPVRDSPAACATSCGATISAVRRASAAASAL